MSDEPTIETRGKGEARRTVVTASLLTVGGAILAAFLFVRGKDLEQLQAVDRDAQKRDEAARGEIVAIQARQAEAERDARAGRDRIIRLEVATENQAKSLDKI